MELRAAEAIPFALPLRAPVRGLRQRRGWLLRLESACGRVGWGEAAPWPGLGAGAEAVGAALARVVAALPRTTAALLERDLPAEAAFACEAAALDLEAGARGLTLAAHLDPAPAERVPLHALVADAAGARAAAAAGYRALKVKVGADLEADDARVAAIRAAVGPGLALRLDANGAWSGDAARRAVERLGRHGLEWIEQPTPPDDLRGLAAVRRLGVPVAVDEGLSVHGLDAVLAAEAADVVVLKPARLGLRAGLDLGRRAAAAGLGVCVTSLLEGLIGRTAALHLAAALPAGARRAAGLGGDHLLRDHAPAPGPAGALALPRGPGLGVEPALTETTGGGRPA